jgi:hypothetical protein
MAVTLTGREGHSGGGRVTFRSRSDEGRAPAPSAVTEGFGHVGEEDTPEADAGAFSKEETMNTNVIDKWNTENGHLSTTSDQVMARRHTAHLAHHLSTVAVRQWEKTLTGLVAFPAAAALGVAATATYGVALLERGFEVFESALGEMGRSLNHEEHGQGHENHRERPVDRTPEARS